MSLCQKCTGSLFLVCDFNSVALAHSALYNRILYKSFASEPHIIHIENLPRNMGPGLRLMQFNIFFRIANLYFLITALVHFVYIQVTVWHSHQHAKRGTILILALQHGIIRIFS